MGKRRQVKPCDALPTVFANDLTDGVAEAQQAIKIAGGKGGKPRAGGPDGDLRRKAIQKGLRPFVACGQGKIHRQADDFLQRRVDEGNALTQRLIQRSLRRQKTLRLPRLLRRLGRCLNRRARCLFVFEG